MPPSSEQSNSSKGQSAQNETIIEKLGHDELCETIESAPLAAWMCQSIGSADSDTSVEQLANYLAINQILAPWVGNGATHSAYANNAKVSM